MATVEINGEDYFVYADLPTADLYMEAAFGERADAWREAEPDAKSRALVSGFRAIDAQQWKGEQTDPDQPGAFPRTGLFYRNGQPVPSDEVPVEVVNANIELGAMLNAGESIDPAEARAATAKRLKAGSVEIESFRQFGIVGLFPPTVQKLLSFWLLGTGAAGMGGSQSFGTHGKSAFRSPQYKPSRGF